MDDRVAYTNFWPDEDEVVRQAQFRITFEQVQGNASEPESEQFLSFAARADGVPITEIVANLTKPLG